MQYLRSRWAVGLAVAGSLALAGTAFAAGRPLRALDLTMEASHAGTTITVSGVSRGALVDIVRLEGRTKGREVLVAHETVTKSGTVTRTFPYRARVGVYAAVEVLRDRSVRLSELFGWKTPAPLATAAWEAHAGAVGPAVSLAAGRIRAANTINGMLVGTTSISEVNGDYVITWTYSGLQVGDLVQLVGAGPVNGQDPFDNIPANDVYDAQFANVTTAGTVTFTISANNIVDTPLTNTEWFNVSLFSSEYESPPGQLPEVPYAAALPLVMAIPALLWMRRRRTS